MVNKFLEKKTTQVILFLVFGLSFILIFSQHIILPVKAFLENSIYPCTKIKVVHRVELKENKFSPKETDAKRCDQLVIINKDLWPHEVAIGSHPNHLKYPGFEEKILKPGDSNKFILSVSGKYLLHDHLNEEIQGSVSVN